jgi:hypothetical protein
MRYKRGDMGANGHDATCRCGWHHYFSDEQCQSLATVFIGAFAACDEHADGLRAVTATMNRKDVESGDSPTPFVHAADLLGLTK